MWGSISLVARMSICWIGLRSAIRRMIAVVSDEAEKESNAALDSMRIRIATLETAIGY